MLKTLMTGMTIVCLTLDESSKESFALSLELDPYDVDREALLQRH